MPDVKIHKPPDATARRRRKRAAELGAVRKMLRRKYGTLSESTDGIRAGRQARG